MRHVLWATGFRPFFLLAALLAVVSVPLWMLWLLGMLSLDPALPGVLWHAHEMVWGYTVAVIAGFLLTAARNWTGRYTASGGHLAFLVVLWLAGRVAVWLGGSWPPGLVIAVDVAFLPVLAFYIGRPLVQAGSRRNYGFPVLLLVLAAANLAVHLSGAGSVDPLGPIRNLALDAVALIIAIVGGRIVPLFTGNALREVTITRHPLVDRAALWALAVLIVLDVIALAEPGVAPTAAAVAVVAGGLHLLRMRGWGSLATLRHPILWVLHVGYLFVPIALVLRGLSTLTGLSSSLGTHVLAVGAIGTLTLGMMTRVALGHTGRPLRVSRPIAAAYLMVVAAVPVRAAGALWPAWSVSSWTISASLFAAAFLIYLVEYAPILTRPRPDGRPG